jgi:hypothetical protein
MRAVKAYGGADVYLHSLLNGGEWSQDVFEKQREKYYGRLQSIYLNQ